MAGNFDLFHALEPEKKQRILNAALDEFAGKGFKRASTNEIVKKAGIGKGMLFYYFGSKTELFEFLCEYALEFAANEYAGHFKAETGDFIERYRQLSEIKRRAMDEFKHLLNFVTHIYLDDQCEFTKRYSEQIKNLRERATKTLFDNLDCSLFKDDLKPDLTVKYIIWLMEAYERDMVARIKHVSLNNQELAEEWEKYYAFLDDLKKIFYRG